MTRTVPASRWTGPVVGLILGIFLTSSDHAEAAGGGCARPGALGISRIVDIDTRGGPHFGDVSRNVREPTFLGPKEVVLTFDDGPIPWITKSILGTLDKYCTKATFFSVGQMALAYPQYSKEVIARGHTLGAHTWSHPMNLAHLSYEKAKDQIERGFAAVTLAAGQPIAPFFRFPGLNDSDPLLAHLQTRGIASFTVDVVSNDSYIANPSRLTQRTLAEIEQHKGGIILFHDIKASTARALPAILSELDARGYRVVHMVAKHPFVPDDGRAGEFRGTIAAAEKSTGSRPAPVPFYGTTGPTPVPVADADQPAASREKSSPRGSAVAGSEVYSAAGADGWVTVVKRAKSRSGRPPVLRVPSGT